MAFPHFLINFSSLSLRTSILCGFYICSSSARNREKGSLIIFENQLLNGAALIQNVCQHGFGNNRLIRLGLSKKKSTLRV